ncbi:MAG: cupin domain-containing protein [Deltaproteobacteria bacterium]|nr:cupin domain-containing protein [Deltaproteobacteria bacterium]
MATYTAHQYYTAHTEDLPWQCAPTPGISFKSLRFDPDTGQGAVLIHMTPNSVYPRHIAHGGLDVLVVDGEVVWDGQTVARGGFIHLPPGTHSEPRTVGGCVLYATFSGKVENLHQGWNPRAPAAQ